MCADSTMCLQPQLTVSAWLPGRVNRVVPLSQIMQIIRIRLIVVRFVSMRILFILSLFTVASFGQVRIVTVDTYPGNPGHSIGAFFSHKNPAVITAFSEKAVYNSIDSGKTWTSSKLSLP